MPHGFLKHAEDVSRTVARGNGSHVCDSMMGRPVNARRRTLRKMKGTISQCDLQARCTCCKHKRQEHQSKGWIVREALMREES